MNVVDLKIRLNGDKMPKLVMDALMAKAGLDAIIDAANKSGLKVTVVIDHDGGTA